MAAITNELPEMAMSIRRALRTQFTMIKMLVGAGSFSKMVLWFILVPENALNAVVLTSSKLSTSDIQ